MLKKIILATLFLLITNGYISAQLSPIGVDNNLYTTDPSDAVYTDDINDPIRDGTYDMVKDVQGISNSQITEHSDAQNQTLGTIKRVINYALGLAGLVALIYLIYHGFLMVTAAGDDTQYNKGIKGLKTAGIALGGIGVSYFVVSLIFYVIRIITGN